MHFQVLYECMESLWSFNTALQVHRVVICEFVLICYLHYVTSWIYCTCNFRINLTTSLITINCCHDWNPQAKMGCKSVIMFYWHHMMMFFFFLHIVYFVCLLFTDSMEQQSGLWSDSWLSERSVERCEQGRVYGAWWRRRRRGESGTREEVNVHYKVTVVGMPSRVRLAAWNPASKFEQEGDEVTGVMLLPVLVITWGGMQLWKNQRKFSKRK